MSVRVLRPGLLTTVQDEGRHGYQRVGLCPGGAMDPVAFALANALVGNEPNEAALEITVIGPELQFEQDTLVAVCGAEFQGSFPHNRPTLVRKGSRFNVGRAVRGARAYLAVAGGFARRAGARQPQHLPAGHFGGFEGRALKRGDVLPLRDAAAAEAFAKRFEAKAKAATREAGRRRRSRCPTASRSWCTRSRAQHYASFDATSQRAFLRHGVERGARVEPHGLSPGRAARSARPKADEILSGPTCLGIGAGAAERRADRADGRPPDHRRLSAHRRDRLGRRAAPRAARARRQGALRALQPGHRGASCARTRASGSQTAAARHRLGIRQEMKKIDLNCDMGESYGAWKMGADAEVMPHISSANIACGFHGGDPATIRKTVRLALDHGVAIGAHPSLPDIQGFGRRVMKISPQDMYDLVVYQAGAVEASRARRARSCTTSSATARSTTWPRTTRACPTRWRARLRTWAT